MTDPAANQTSPQTPRPDTDNDTSSQDPDATRTAQPPAASSADQGTVAGQFAALASSQSGTADPSGASGTAVFSSIGDYSVIKKIGEGGMGAVYLAEDPALGRKVAIKTMRAELAANKLDRDRFEREARTAAAVESDHIVPILHVGKAPDGTPFIAMPFLQGEMLDARLKREPVAHVSLILKVAREVAEGLAAAHEKGLIHRDIKPGNVWLEGDLSSKEPSRQIRRCKILDFGLARSVDKDDSQLTASGAILGTPAFMAPEQARGEKVDHRADLFSLGVMLYRMATGKQPFRGPNSMAVLIALTTETPPPVGTVAPNLPPGLADLIDRLMAKDPAGRPQSAAEVSATVRQLMREWQAKRTASAATMDQVRLPPLPDQSSAEISASLPQAIPEAVPVEEATPTEELEPPRPKKRKKAAREAEPEPAKRSRLPLVIALVAVGLFGVVVVGAVVGIIATGKRNTEATAKGDPPNRYSGKEKLKEEEPDRKAAEYVLSVGGSVRVNDEVQDIKAPGGLPKGPFRLTWVWLASPAQVTDDGLAVFEGCRDVTDLWLSRANVTDAGLAHFRNCKQLKSLAVGDTRIGDAGLAHFKDCDKLVTLLLQKTQVTDKGLSAFGRCPQLITLDVVGTGVSEKGLAWLKDCKKLVRLRVQNTKVTASGVQELRKLLPQAIIEWDGGTIEPAGTGEADRKAAEYVLTIRGMVGVYLGDREQSAISFAKDLPKEPFRLTTCLYPPMFKRATNDDLAVLKGCKSLRYLTVTFTAVNDKGAAATVENPDVTDAGMVHIKDCKNLNILQLDGARVTDASVELFKQFTQLTELSLRKTKVTAKGIDELKKSLPQCRIDWDGGIVNATVVSERTAAEFVLSDKGTVRVNGEARDIKHWTGLPPEPFRLTEASLFECKLGEQFDPLYFKDCKNLTALDLRKTGVTAKAVENLSKALPGCKITWDGGTIGPKK